MQGGATSNRTTSSSFLMLVLSLSCVEVLPLKIYAILECVILVLNPSDGLS